MKKIGSNSFKVEDKDDLWYLSHIISKDDVVKGKTSRKIKIGNDMVKKTITLSVKVEKVEYSADSLRINGLVQEEFDDIPKGSFHTIPLIEGSVFTLYKENWLGYQKNKLNEALKSDFVKILMLIFDREEAFFVVSKKYGYEILIKVQGQVEKKAEKVQVRDFFSELVKLLKEYDEKLKPKHIVIASPAFWKEELKNRVGQELFKKIVLTTCGSVSENAVHEVLKKDEIQQVLKKDRVSKELKIVDSVLNEISKQGLAEYGFKEVSKAVELGAVKTLLVTEGLIQKKRNDNTYDELDKLMNLADQMKAEINIISSEASKNLDGLGGIACLLRYKIN